MRAPSCAALLFINADVGGGEPTTLRVVGSRIAALGACPAAGDRIVDLDGDRLLPGLINAHDHLQLNSLPRLPSRKRYGHVREWIADVDSYRRTEGAFQASVAVPRERRLLAGAVKNLLSGVTTVAHHDPLYGLLSSDSFPTGVVTRFGWSHSLYVEGEERVRSSYRDTPSDWPWIIHAAEGIDEEAAKEFDRLDVLGCVGPNTLIVHGVALDSAQRARLAHAGAGLVWCPSSNLHLFERTTDVGDLIRGGHVALGTDSRLSGSRDLLEELRVAREVGGLDDRTLELLVTGHSAQLLRLGDRGVLQVGARADLLILPAHTQVSSATRADVGLVMLAGRVQYADESYARQAVPDVPFVHVRVDGRVKVLERMLAAQLSTASVAEPGLELQCTTWRAA
jgi:cytosine/adenosine deaminase-related metal-dependent hydrolase